MRKILEPKEDIMEKEKKEKKEKFNLGNVLFWEDGYIIVCTPFNYLDIIDYQNNQHVGIIKLNSNIVIYNISRRIKENGYENSFIFRDNKGKIQYVRKAKVKDKVNIKIDRNEKI